MGDNLVQVEQLYKIFGPSPKKARDLLAKGLTKHEILKTTGNSIGVQGASITIEQGEIFVIVGLSGSGKSTLLRCINRLIEPTFGHVFIEGEDVTQLDEEKLRLLRRRKLAMVFQNFALFPNRTVRANVEYGLEIQGVEAGKRREKAHEMLALVELEGWAERRPGELSGGMQQRVGLARALATDPDILLMDEAFGALDPLIRREMQEELLKLQARLNKTIIFITHDLNEAAFLGTHIAVMCDGAIVQVGTPLKVLTDPANGYVASFVKGVNRAEVLRAQDIMRPLPAQEKKEAGGPLQAGNCPVVGPEATIAETAALLLTGADQALVQDALGHLIGAIGKDEILKTLIRGGEGVGRFPQDSPG